MSSSLSSPLAAAAAKDIDTFLLTYPPVPKIIPWPLGDLFRMAERLAPVHYVYRTWHFSCASPDMGRRESPHKLCFHWSVPGGNWLLIADGCVVALDRKLIVEHKKEYLMNDQFYIQFDFVGQNFSLNVSKSKLSWEVILLMNQSPLDEMRSLPDDPLPHVKPLNFAIDATKMMIGNGKVTTWYQLSCDHPSTGKRFYVARRYSDFETYDGIIKGYTSRHMRPALPVLPGKVFNPFTNQLSDDFIEERRRTLEMYMRTILNNPKLSGYTETFCFLGFHPTTAEVVENGTITYFDEDPSHVTTVGGKLNASSMLDPVTGQPTEHSKNLMDDQK